MAIVTACLIYSTANNFKIILYCKDSLPISFAEVPRAQLLGRLGVYLL